MSKDNLPAITKEDLLVTSSPFEDAQIQLFYQKTPADKIMKRPAKGGGEWEYVKTGYVVETLNRIFGYLWSFEVLTTLEEAAKIAASGTCVVKGRLTAYVGDQTLTKEQFGRCEVKFKTAFENGKKVRTNEFLDFGNDMKGAASDALKKCASEFGLFRDVYHKDDFLEANIVTEEEKQRLKSEKYDNAKAEMRKAKNMDELKEIFTKLPADIRGHKDVVASKNALKRKFEKKEKTNEG